MVDICRIQTGRKKRATEEQLNAFMEALSPYETHKLLARTMVWGWHEPGEDPSIPRSYNVSGSGVLVKGAWGQGIVTAGHCLRPAEQGRVLTATVLKMHRASPGSLVGYLVDGKMLRQAAVYPNKEKSRRGPDIAFVPLAKQLMKSMEAETGAVFHNIDLDLGREDASFERQPGMFQAVGHVRSDGEEAEARCPDEEGKKLVIPRVVQVRRVPRARCQWRGGWDYIPMECLAEASEHSTIYELGDGTPSIIRDLTLKEPVSWKGMSGAGVWWSVQDKQGRIGVGLCGVVFFQYYGNRQGHLRLYGHGKTSLRRIIEEAKEAEIDYTPPLSRVSQSVRTG